MAVKVIRDDGFLTLYNGLSASCLRQATYTTTRFAIYGSIKAMKTDSNLSFIEKISLAAASGAVGAFVGLFIQFIENINKYETFLLNKINRSTS